jgi:prepilin-type N-terminal cleavage/methylation domain-containing protein
MMREKLYNSRPAAAGGGVPRRGFTLIEVLVVLVILIIGMFAIARLFPEGFASINATGNKTQAETLIRRNSNYLQEFRDNLPDGIVGVDPRNGTIRTGMAPVEFFGGLPYTENTINSYSGPLPLDPRYADINQVRRVIGERLKLAPPTTITIGANSETASLYHVLFSPMYSATALGTASLGVKVYGGTPLQRIVFQNPPSTEDLDRLKSLGPYAYGINYETATLYFAGTSYDRAYQVEYSYRTGPACGERFDSGAISFPVAALANGGPDPQTVSLSDAAVFGARALPAGANVDASSDALYRQFNGPLAGAFSTQSGAGAPVTLDPFEFKVYDTLYGLLGFNPAAATQPVPEQQGRGIEVRIDYDVDDWHILRQDEAVPTEQLDVNAGTGLHAIKLISDGIKQVGDIEDTINFVAAGSGNVDTTYQYPGLIRSYPGSPGRAGTPGVDLVVVDLQTGLRIDSTTLQKLGNSGNGDIDYAKGILHLKDAATWSPPGGGAPSVAMSTGGRRVRIYYRIFNDMGVATLKPYTSYFRSASAPADRQYFQFSSGFLLFTSQDAEKTVAVDYTWQSKSTGAIRTETGELHRVEAPEQPVRFGPNLPAGTTAAWLRLTHADTDPSRGAGDSGADADVKADSVCIRGVRGASVHTRVVWQEGPRRTHLQHSTIITRDERH